MANLLTGVNRLLLKVFGSRNDRVLKELWPLVTQVNDLEPQMEKLSDEALGKKTEEFRNRFSEGETLDDLMPEAFAVAREGARRFLKTPSGVAMRHFDVQILGGIVLHQGKIAEMGTGEGKTLVATLAAYLNAIPGRGVHIITVNDYLARRDRDWMSTLFGGLGMTSGAIRSDMDNLERREQYGCDITYGTNNEFGFDYLRDNMKVSLEEQVQRRRAFAIVDEVDSILIDEARTPLIISGPAERSVDKYSVANRVAKRLTRGQEFDVKEKERSVMLTEPGIEKAEKMVGVPSFYVGEHMEWPHLISQALSAHYLHQRDVDYVVRDGEVVIVDEFTGRLMEGRTWSEGLHQAVEAKEGLQIRRENQTLATITLQNFFKLYEKISGMTGTAMTEAVEFDRTYGLEVVSVPPNRPSTRDDQADVVFRTAREKYKAIVEEIVEINTEGRPILVGTVSIEKSELLSGMLKRRGVAHEVLNAKNHQREAEIIANAGQPSKVTISTNMAGRGTDIVLGPGVKEKGGLHVLGTERHEARRIDNQLRGRCGRQGDPGSSKFFLSLEDDLMRRFAADRVSAMLKRFGMEEGEEISHPLVTRSIARAQKKVEAYHFDIRRNLLQYDEVMNEQRGLVYTQRQQVLEGQDLPEMVRKMLVEVVKDRVNYYFTMETPPPSRGDEDEAEPDPLEELRTWLASSYGIVMPDFGIESEEQLEDQVDGVADRIIRAYDAVYGKKREEMGDELMQRAERFILLMKIDEKWKDHLHAMDQLRHGIGLRSYGNIDPKVAYKQEGYKMFSQLIDSLRAEVTSLLLRVQVRKEDETRLHSGLENAEYQHAAPGEVEARTQSDEATANRSSGPAKPIVNKDAKVGRNEPCPCGSGKKYKKCHGVGA